MGYLSGHAKPKIKVNEDKIKVRELINKELYMRQFGEEVKGNRDKNNL